MHIENSFKKIKESYKLKKSLIEKEIQHDEIYEVTWEEKENQWLPYSRNDVLAIAFCYARYTVGMEELTGFGMKKSLTLPSLANEKFNSLSDENDEPIYSYTDAILRKFDRQSIKRGRCNAFNQQYKSEISGEVFINISKELNVNDNICDLLEKHFEFLNK